jgi:hypothetical protein
MDRTVQGTDTPKAVRYGGLFNYTQSKDDRRLTHPTLLPHFSCVTPVGWVSRSDDFDPKPINFHPRCNPPSKVLLLPEVD